MSVSFSRRAVLAQLGSAGLAATAAPSFAQNAFSSLDGRKWFFLSDIEARYLAAFCDVLIPEDEYPSASQAGVVDFIDLQLASAYGQGGGLYLQGPFPEGVPEQGYQLPFTPSELIRKGIAAARRVSPEREALVDMPTQGREAHVKAMSDGDIAMEPVGGQTFFNEVWQLANQGYFADPMYDGNKNYAGWKMVGFPGAHAQYMSFVDNHNLDYPVQPKGITHDTARDTPQHIMRRGKED